ncbi:MAG: hypothetical protein KJ971_05910 [Firmicutes bacterium]|nr:hypothetical protein [Bacillota bacterium]
MKEEIYNQLHLTKKGNTYVGNLNGVTYSLVDVDMGTISMKGLMFVFNHSIQNETRRLIQKKIRNSVRFSTFKMKNDSLIIVLPFKLFKKEEEFNEKNNLLLCDSINAFQFYELHQYQECVICHKVRHEEKLDYRVWDVSYVPVHPKCAADHVKDVKQSVEKENSKSNRLILSIILSLVGAFVGLIPLVMILYISDAFYAILYALIPLGGFYGYKLGKAPRKTYMIYIIIIISVLIVVAFELFTWNILALSLDYTLSGLLEDSTYQYVFLNELLISLLFLGIGIFISWKLISNTSDKQINKIETLNK